MAGTGVAPSEAFRGITPEPTLARALGVETEPALLADRYCMPVPIEGCRIPMAEGGRDVGKAGTGILDADPFDLLEAVDSVRWRRSILAAGVES